MTKATTWMLLNMEMDDALGTTMICVCMYGCITMGQNMNGTLGVIFITTPTYARSLVFALFPGLVGVVFFVR